MNIIDEIEQFIERRANNIIKKHEYYNHNSGHTRDIHRGFITEIRRYYDDDYNHGVWITNEYIANEVCFVLGINIDFYSYKNYRVIAGRPLLINNDPMLDNKLVFCNMFKGYMGIIDDVNHHEEDPSNESYSTQRRG